MSVLGKCESCKAIVCADDGHTTDTEDAIYLCAQCGSGKSPRSTVASLISEVDEIEAENRALLDLYDRLASAVLGVQCSAVACFGGEEYEKAAHELRAARDQLRNALTMALANLSNLRAAPLIGVSIPPQIDHGLREMETDLRRALATTDARAPAGRAALSNANAEPSK